MAERDRVDNVEVVVPPGMSEEFYTAALAAGWSDDPGTGKAILIKDRAHPNYGGEILNPQPMAPPVGYVADDTLEDMVRRHMQKQFNLMRGDEVIDEGDEVDDFDVPDELPDLESVYTVRELEPEVPDFRSEMTEAVAAALERQKKAPEEAPVKEEEGA